MKHLKCNFILFYFDPALQSVIWGPYFPQRTASLLSYVVVYKFDLCEACGFRV